MTKIIHSDDTLNIYYRTTNDTTEIQRYSKEVMNKVVSIQ